MLAHCCRVPWHGWKSVAPWRKARRQASGCGDAGSSGGAGSSGSRQRRRRDGSVSGAVPNAEKHRVSARGDCSMQHAALYCWGWGRGGGAQPQIPLLAPCPAAAPARWVQGRRPLLQFQTHILSPPLNSKPQFLGRRAHLGIQQQEGVCGGLLRRLLHLQAHTRQGQHGLQW